MRKPLIEREILLIESDPMVSLAMRYALEQAGFRVRAVADGESGIREWRAHPPDIIVTDLMLPARDSTEVIRTIRNSGSHLPILAFSGTQPPCSTPTEGSKGADQLLQKPVRAEQLVATINALLTDAETCRAK